MPRKTLSTDNWIMEKRDGTKARFSTYVQALNTKRAHPEEYAKDADISYIPTAR